MTDILTKTPEFSDQNYKPDPDTERLALATNWTPDPDVKGILWKRGKAYIDVDWQGRVIRYNVNETLLQRCLRLKKDVPKTPDGQWVWPDDELQLLYKVVAKLGSLKAR